MALPPGGGSVKLPEGKCVRAAVSNGHADLHVNGNAVGEVREGAPLDITPYLRSTANEIRASSQAVVTLLIGPRVYIEKAERIGKSIAAAVVNTTEHTMQVELGERDQFTVSPGTTVYREIQGGGVSKVRMRATSDGLDLVYEDEAEVVNASARTPRN